MNKERGGLGWDGGMGGGGGHRRVREGVTMGSLPTNLQLALCSGKGQAMRSSKLLSRPGLPEGLTLESVSCICQVSTYLAHPVYTLSAIQWFVGGNVGGGFLGGGGGGVLAGD